MADDERREDHASLELPSLRSAFRRGRARKRPTGPEPTESAHDESAHDESARDESVIVPPEEPLAGPELSPGPVGLPETRPEVAAGVATATDDPPAPRPQRRSLRVHLPGPIAAALTGAVVGLVLVGLTAGSQHLCSTMRGTSSCGTPGLLLLLVIAVAAGLVGSMLLWLAGVSAHDSTSVLALALLVVLVLLTLLSVLDEWWVVIAVPLLSMVTYVAAWWLTTTYADQGERAR
jgi:hypothetical protein